MELFKDEVFETILERMEDQFDSHDFILKVASTYLCESRGDDYRAFNSLFNRLFHNTGNKLCRYYNFNQFDVVRNRLQVGIYIPSHDLLCIRVNKVDLPAVVCFNSVSRYRTAYFSDVA